jgi:hypothetical protein
MFKKRMQLGPIWGVALGLGLLGLATTALADCPDPSPRKYTVSVSSKHPNQISIAEPVGSPRHLALRNGLMPEVHYLPDGRHALLTTQDAWVIRLDLAQARSVAEVRVGQSVRSVALSGQRTTLPSVLAVANAEPNTLVLLDENLQTLQVVKVVDKTGRQPKAIAMVHTAQARSSFVASLLDLAELWEISYNPTAPEIAMGMVHDFQYREGSFVPGYLNVQRIPLPTPAREFFLTNEGHEVLSAHPKSGPDGPANPAVMQVTHLDVRGKVAEFDLPQWPVSPELMKRTYGEADCSGLAK